MIALRLATFLSHLLVKVTSVLVLFVIFRGVFLGLIYR